MSFLPAKLKLSNSGVKHQIMVLVSVGILAMALISSFLTSWVTTKNARQRLISEGMHITSGFAEQSILAMLFESPDNAKDSAAAALSFPNVIHVSLHKPDGDLLLLEEANGVSQEFDDTRMTRVRRSKSQSPNLDEEQVEVLEGREHIHIRAPIYEPRADNEEFIFAGNDVPRKFLGFADVVLSKEELNAQRVTTIVQNSVVSIVLALLLLLVLHKVISRITTPLSELSTLMREQDSETETSRAEVTGPIEIQDIARAFNAMMDVLDERDLRLRNQNDGLENQVRARTRELVEARDAAIRASQHKSAFLANMSHELRTPLNAVLGYTNMVIEDIQDGELCQERCIDDLSRVENAGKHLLSMINNILDLAKIEAGRMDLEFDDVDIKQLLRQVEDTILPLVKSGQNQLKIQLSTDSSPLVMDPVKLRQILVNLLGNACKFTKSGTITLQVDHSEKALKCAVTDTGIGMNEEQLERIFTAFKQADMTTTKTFGGTGLGLTISQRLCALMGTDIKVTSAMGEGSCFYFTIPLPMQEHQPEEEALAS